MSHQRGALTLFKNIFDEPATEIQSTGSSLRQRKIDCIIDFYYYTGKKNPKYSYAALLGECSDAFFLSTFTLSDIIQENLAKVREVKQEWKEQPVEKLQKHFTKKWPRFVW